MWKSSPLESGLRSRLSAPYVAAVFTFYCFSATLSRYNGNLTKLLVTSRQELGRCLLWPEHYRTRRAFLQWVCGGERA